MLDVERFIEDCRHATREADAHRAVQSVVERAVADPAAVIAALGEPGRAEVQPLHHAGDLTILHVVWGPGMTIMPHDHRMWAVIGVYTGREDNIFWRRIPGRDDGRVNAAGARTLGARDVATLGVDVIHSVVNPVPRLTGAIHVYGGDFFAVSRSEWDPETLREGRYDADKAMRLFEESNARLATAHEKG